MNAEIISVGTELLLGHTVNTDTTIVARALSDLGINLLYACTVGDNEGRLKLALEQALQRSDLVITTGGLGPTKDDVTKKVLAEYFDTRLVMNEDVLRWIGKLLENGGMRMNEGNRSQAILPESAKILYNRKGTASGMWFERDGKVLVSLPGVPFEMEDLMIQSVIPELQRLYPHLHLDYRMLKVYDIPESELALLLEKWEEHLPEGFSLAYLPSPGFVKLRLTAKGDQVFNLDARYDSLKEALEGQRYTEGENGGTERELGELLMLKGKTIATAESCTGGNIAAQLTSIAGSSAYFRGSIVAYANDVKERVLGVRPESLEQFGAVSEPVVRQMAEGARRLVGTDYAVSTSGIAGPTGGTVEKPIGTVWIGVAGPERTIARKFVFSFTRERNIGKATMKAIEMVIEEVRNGAVNK